MNKKNMIESQLKILRNSVDNSKIKVGKKKLQTPEIKKILNIIENFLVKKKLIVYGGTAINNILPKNEQFYGKDYTLPDYDFFSPTPIDHAKELCDIYLKNGFTEIEAKSAQHYGTYKVFVNFLPVADITEINEQIFKNIKKEAIIINNIFYAPPNFLRMSIYNELSRPEGDVSRWEKIFKRLVLLNKYYPVNDKKLNCNSLIFGKQQEQEEDPQKLKNKQYIKNIFLDILLHEDIVFFGGYSDIFYMKYIPNKKYISSIPVFDILSKNPEELIKHIEKKIQDKNKKEENNIKLKITLKPNIGDLMPLHYNIKIGNFTILNIYKTNYCYSYNTITVNNNKIKIASIETKMYFYLIFLYLNDKNYNTDRILCLSLYLFLIQENNKLKQRGLLKRFPINCYGNEKTLEEIRELKTNKFKELKNYRKSSEYEKWFFRYIPKEKNITKKKNNTKNKNNTKKKNTVT